MDDLDYLEDEQIKTHKEILSMLQDVEDYEKQIEHPESQQPSVSEPEFFEVPESQEPIGELSSEEKPEQPTFEPELKKHKPLVSFPHRTRKKVPRALVGTSQLHKILLERKKHKPHDVFISKRSPRKHRLLGQSITSVTPQSTFTLRLDSEGNLVGFHIKPPRPGKETQEKKQKHKFLRKKKHGDEKTEETTEPTKGFKNKLKKIIPHRKSKTEGEESGGKSKLKGMLSRRRKTKAEKE